MSKNLESKLRDALQPVAPSEEFARRMVTRLAEKRVPLPQAKRAGDRLRKSAAWWGFAALAACLLAAVGIQHRLQAERERAIGMQARRQVIEALRVTSQKLDLAYQVIRTQSSAVNDADPGV